MFLPQRIISYLTVTTFDRFLTVINTRVYVNYNNNNYVIYISRRGTPGRRDRTSVPTRDTVALRHRQPNYYTRTAIKR